MAGIDKSSDKVKIECELEGYERALTVLPARFDSTTWGNALFGFVPGLLYAGVDAVSGAIHDYPNSVVVRLKRERTEAEVASAR